MMSSNKLHLDFLPVNNRVKNYDMSWDAENSTFSWGDIELTAAEPIKSTK